MGGILERHEERKARKPQCMLIRRETKSSLSLFYKTHTDRLQTHDHNWSVSEQAATEYGKKTAESISLVAKPTKQQLRWYKFTQLFRKIMRNRQKVILAIRA